MSKKRDLTITAREHVLGYKRSGLTQTEYCRRHGLSSSSFWGWKSKYEAEDKEQSAGQFIGLSNQNQVELEFPGGIKVKLDSQTDIKLLKLLKEAYGV